MNIHLSLSENFRKNGKLNKKFVQHVILSALYKNLCKSDELKTKSRVVRSFSNS